MSALGYPNREAVRIKVKVSLLLKLEEIWMIKVLTSDLAGDLCCYLHNDICHKEAWVNIKLKYVTLFKPKLPYLTLP